MSDDADHIVEGVLVVRAIARLRGRIVSIEVEPLDAPPQLTVRIQDSWGRLDAIFMGRRSIPGIEPGAVVAVEGRVCESESIPRLFNPKYELVSAP